MSGDFNGRTPFTLVSEGIFFQFSLNFMFHCILVVFVLCVIQKTNWEFDSDPRLFSTSGVSNYTIS